MTEHCNHTDSTADLSQVHFRIWLLLLPDLSVRHCRGPDSSFQKCAGGTFRIPLQLSKYTLAQNPPKSARIIRSQDITLLLTENVDSLCFSYYKLFHAHMQLMTNN